MDLYADPDHYVTHHLPLVARLPGLLAWRHSVDVAAARESPQGRQVPADVANYATGAAVIHRPVRDGIG